MNNLQKRILRAASIGFKIGAGISTAAFLSVKLISSGAVFPSEKAFMNCISLAAISGLLLAGAFAAFLVLENAFSVAGTETYFRHEENIS